MAKQGKRKSRWFTHRRLVTAETLLLLGAAQTLAEDWMLDHTDLFAAIKVVLLMALTLGVFTALLLFLEKATKKGVTTTHDMVQSLPIPTPMMLVHGAIFVALFFLYAWTFNLHRELWPWG